MLNQSWRSRNVFLAFPAFHLYRHFWGVGRVKKATVNQTSNILKKSDSFLTIPYKLIQQMLIEEYLTVIIIINNINNNILYWSVWLI